MRLVRSSIDRSQSSNSWSYDKPVGSTPALIIVSVYPASFPRASSSLPLIADPFICRLTKYPTITDAITIAIAVMATFEYERLIGPLPHVEQTTELSGNWVPHLVQ